MGRHAWAGRAAPGDAAQQSGRPEENPNGPVGPAALSFSPMMASGLGGMPSLTMAVMASWIASCTFQVAK